MIAVFIAYTGIGIARDTSKVLADRVVMDEEAIRRVVMSVPDVLGSHRIRTRGTSDHVFLDLHVWVNGDTTLHEAHRLSHVVKDRLMQKYPQIADAIIHIEPPPPRTKRSVAAAAGAAALLASSAESREYFIRWMGGCRRSAGLVRPRPTSASRKTCSAHTLASLAAAASSGCV